MPFANEHACRLRDPGDFQDDSFVRQDREHEGKKYSVILGRLKDEEALTQQAFRYPKETWDVDVARAHCTGHDGQSFEAASEKGRALERKSAAIEIKDAEKGEVEAVFATLNVKDKDGDLTLPGAFEDGAEVLIGAYGHSTWMGELPVGKGVIKTTDKEARLLGTFFLDTQGGREHFNVIRNLGPKQQWSYGFDVKETGELTEEMEQRGIRRVLKKLEVHEVSPVLLGAGLHTRTVDVKATDEAAEQAAREVAQVAEGVAAEQKATEERAAKEKQRQEIDAGIQAFERTRRQFGA